MLWEVSFDVWVGEYLVIIGVNGLGKIILMLILVGWVLMLGIVDCLGMVGLGKLGGIVVVL